jgi:hypothetical protein
MKKLLLGTAIATILVTASYAQTQTSSTPDSTFAAAHDIYDGAKNAECRTPEVENAINSLSKDIAWTQNWIVEMGVLMNSISLSDPNNEMMNRLRELRNQENALLKRAEFEKEQMRVWFANLYGKPACPTPATPTSAIPPVNPGPTPPVNVAQPPQVNVPQPPANSDDPPPETCPTDVNAIIGLIRLHLTPGSIVEQTPAPYWQKETVDGACTWYLSYYTKDADGGFGWNILHTNIPCTDSPPGSSTHKAAGSDGSSGAQYCPSSTGLNPPKEDGTETQVARSTPVAWPPMWISGVTPPDSSDHLSDKLDTDSDQTARDSTTAKQPPKTDDKLDTRSDSKPSDTRRTDSKSDSKTGQSQIKANDHANAKSVGAGEHANAKSESNFDHASRTVTNNKSEVSQHVAHGHMGGMHEAGMHSGGLGGMHSGGMHHGGGFGGLGGGLGGGIAGMVLNSLGGL